MTDLVVRSAHAQAQHSPGKGAWYDTDLGIALLNTPAGAVGGFLGSRIVALLFPSVVIVPIAALIFGAVFYMMVAAIDILVRPRIDENARLTLTFFGVPTASIVVTRLAGYSMSILEAGLLSLGILVVSSLYRSIVRK